MKIPITQIPPGGMVQQERFSARDIDVETDQIGFVDSIAVRAEVTRITNAVTVGFTIESRLKFNCSRCLEECTVPLHMQAQVSYPVSAGDQVLDIGPDIREEIMLGYPVQVLCDPQCKGLCPRCGENLNKGGCHCATTKEKTF